MAGVKISNLPAATVPLTGAELIAVVQGGATKQAAIGGTIPAAQIINTPTGTIAATNVQTAINEIVTDLSASSGSSLVGFLQAGTGATARTVQAKERESVSVLDFGALGDGTTNDYAAIALAITAAADKILRFPYTGAAYKYGTNITFPANVALQFDPGATLSPVAAQTITYSALVGQPAGVYVANILHPTNVPAAVAGAAQFNNVFSAIGGAGTASVSRVATLAQAQTGGGGANHVLAGNFVVQQNAADTNTVVLAAEFDVNNNKADDVLDPVADERHYAQYIASGGSKKVGPAAVWVTSTSGQTNAFWRYLQVEANAIVSGGFLFDYAGDGTNGVFRVGSDSSVTCSRVNAAGTTNSVVRVDGNAFNFSLIAQNQNTGTGSAGYGFNVSGGAEGSGNVVKNALMTQRGNSNGRGPLLVCINNAATTANCTAADAIAQWGMTGGYVGGAATGGDKGLGTINLSGDIYKNNTAYTNPDYVFEHWATGNIIKYADKSGAEKYRGLQPLAKLKAYIKKKWHLPGLGQKAKGGMFDKSDVLLARLEEAYLYIFQLEERIAKIEQNKKHLG